MRRSWCPRSCELLLALLAAACASAPPAGPELAISHDNSVAQRWPYGLGDCRTKLIAEPFDAATAVHSYWVVRATERGAPVLLPGELNAEFVVRPEFPSSPFAPEPERDYSITTGTDRHGAETRALGGGRFAVRVPANERARQSGFVIRASFRGDSERQEPPKALLVELVRVTGAGGCELRLGEARRARWLIVDPDHGPGEPVDSRSDSSGE